MTTDVDSPTGTPAQRGTGRGLVPARPVLETLNLAAEPMFRFPTPYDPHPGTARVLGMAVYGALLGLAGVGVGLRGFVSVLGGVPTWYVPVLTVSGVASIVLAIGAFLSIHRARLPWILLAVAAAPLMGAIGLAVAY